MLDVPDLVHPLVETAVPNSIRLEAKGALVTGSNMSGKSTFLRALGVNAILAESLYTCTARHYAASRLRVVASLRTADDLTRGKSLDRRSGRLLTIIRSVEGNPPTLCLIDELLAGRTRPRDGRVGRDPRVPVAEGRAAGGRHPRSATGGRCRGDSRRLPLPGRRVRGRNAVRPSPSAGLATTRNAIRLLAMLGFPAEIVERPRPGSSARGVDSRWAGLRADSNARKKEPPGSP